MLLRETNDVIRIPPFDLRPFTYICHDDMYLAADTLALSLDFPKRFFVSGGEHHRRASLPEVKCRFTADT